MSTINGRTYLIGEAVVTINGEPVDFKAVSFGQRRPTARERYRNDDAFRAELRAKIEALNAAGYGCTIEDALRLGEPPAPVSFTPLPLPAPAGNRHARRRELALRRRGLA